MADGPNEGTPIRPLGRRPGSNDTRKVVLDAARARFAVDGFAGASIRKIAADAGVDAALVVRSYGSKDDLFAAAMAMPPETAVALAEALDGPVEGLGERLVRAFLRMWTAPESSGALLATFRSAVTNERAAENLRAFIRARVLEVYAPRFPNLPDAALRATLASSMLIGVVVGRQVVGIDALVDAEFEDIVALVAPSVQTILVTERMR
ncbi:TetR family transcriptional regulator [Curtobacterium sp. PhB115]|uniref:TetR/AcrR family transcriptional regulator n=1 Tax=Curtobacterium sp. PhB115 TaxID=2485173 RepID=UPI000F4B15DE|nr:TetR family transcriptional regulator [Curtobacterium sp. PhB115]ROP74513.1 TetR family transcriptional regulator [Curtobacterium sp. PhB115]